jgi:anti-sigma regulatory factor (Ser/Thr protein kinase)
MSSPAIPQADGPPTERTASGRCVTRIVGGTDAPGRARKCLLTHLDHRISARRASDVALIVSELVTNSVVHAHVGPGQHLFLDTARVGDHLRIAVVDPGCELEPRMRPLDHGTPGGLGLRLVDQISSAWGVCRADDGATRVWCELMV